MKGINKLIWIGLLVNVIMFFAVWYISSSAKDLMHELTYSERDVVRMFSMITIPIGVGVVFQLISVLLLFKVPKLGLAIAIISSVLMLPLSLIFLVGYRYSYENLCYGNFVLYGKKVTNSVLGFKWTQLKMQGVMFIALGVIIGVLGVGIGWLVAAVGLFGLCNSYRLKNRVMIGVEQDALIITPTITSDTYLIPLSNVSLIEENDRLFKLHIKTSGVDKKCTFRKKMIDSEDFQTSLDEILSKIKKQE